MADYKLSELNSIDTIRSDDLLHVRVKKRPEMLGDEDRRMTYQDFLASFKLERFVQIAGSNMTGDLGIVKLLYGGKAVFDPTGSSEITIGDVLKTFKINANGLKLTIADASRSATVYHTLNKPSPNELGMRTNEENDARYSRLAVSNVFIGSQNIHGNSNLLRLKSQNAGYAQYIEGLDLDGSIRWWVGIGSNGSNEVTLFNYKSRKGFVIGDVANLTTTLRITGQVQPSDFSNLDARYFTQTVANQRFAQLAGNNTFSGLNTFSNNVNANSDGAAIILKNKTANETLFILARDSGSNNLWYIGKGDVTSNITIYDYKGDTSIKLNSSGVAFNKDVKITGQVQPSDWANIDSRYIPAETLSSLAKINVANTFTNVQTIVSNNEGLVLRNLTQGYPQYIRGVDTANVSRWWVGVGGANSNDVALNNSYSGTQITLMPSAIKANKNLIITGQVQPSDWSNLDARFLKVSGSTATNLVITETGHGLTTGRLFTIDTRDAFNRVCGWSAMTLVSNIPNYPLDPAAYMFVFGKRDIGYPGQVALHANYSNSGLYLSRCVTTDDEVMFEKIYTDKTKPTPSELGAYTKAETDQKIASAVTNSTDLNKIYPVGIVTWFNSNVNPNTALPGLTWTYLNNGVGRTIRVATASGSDVGQLGGGDSKTLSVGNLPSHAHSFSATTSSFDYGTKGTNSTGGHAHSVSGTTSADGNHAHHLGLLLVNGGDALYGYTTIGNGLPRTLDWLDRRDNKFPNTNTTGNHTHTWSGTTSGAGDHSHSVGIGAHSHTVSGNTGSTGSGSAFDVTNSYIKLMAWVRTA